MVKLYSKPGCMQCKMTERKLNSLNLQYEKINILEDDKAFSHVTEDLGYNALPVIEAENVVFQGFRPDELEKLA